MLITATITLMSQATGNVHPLILIPGNGGNQLEARLDRDYKPSSIWCSSWLNPVRKKSDGWFRLWFDTLMYQCYCLPSPNASTNE